MAIVFGWNDGSGSVGIWVRYDATGRVGWAEQSISSEPTEVDLPGANGAAMVHRLPPECKVRSFKERNRT